MNDLISVKIINRQKMIFQGSVKAISSENEQGPFDVLPRHANFISIIQKGIVLHGSKSPRQKIQIETGILKVWENEASIFLDILSPISPKREQPAAAPKERPKEKQT